MGPSLAALIVYLAMDMRLSVSKVKQILFDIFGLKLSKGCIQNCKMEAARALAPVEEQLVSELLDSELIFVDETPHFEAGSFLWMWVFISAHTCVFQIGDRSREIFDNLIREGKQIFTGWLMSDGYRVYRDNENRLRCWAHIYRKAVGLSECYTRASRQQGRQLLNY